MELPRRLIERTGYLERIKPFMRKNIAKVLTGQRRVGKSFLLFQLMKYVLEAVSYTHLTLPTILLV